MSRRQSLGGRGAPAPIRADVEALVLWILGHFDEASDALGRALTTEVLGLLRAIGIALRQPDRFEQLDTADDHLIALRDILRVAEARRRIDERQLVHGLELADQIGRQLGGWIKSLGPA